MQKTSKRVYTKTETQEDSQEAAESSVIEEAEAFLDEVDQLLEDQEVLVRFRQRSGQ